MTMLQDAYLGGGLQSQDACQQLSAHAGRRASAIVHCSHERGKVRVGGQARADRTAPSASADVHPASSGARLAQVGLSEAQSAGNQRHKLGRASSISPQ